MTSRHSASAAGNGIDTSVQISLDRYMLIVADIHHQASSSCCGEEA